MNWRAGGLSYCLAVLVVSVNLAGCAVLSEEARRERALRKTVLADQKYDVGNVPSDAPAQLAASLRMAAQGYQAMQEGRFQEAEDKLERALSLDSRNPFCYLYLAEIRFEGGDARQALILLNQGEVLFQGHPYWLGEIYARKGQYLESLYVMDKAQRAYGRALEYNPWNRRASQGLQRTGSSDRRVR